MTRDKHRTPVSDRARRRAVRAHAARLGVPYSVAMRLLSAGHLASAARTAASADDHRAWLLAARARRSFAVRVTDTRQAVDLPLGRARHLTERFPPQRVPWPLFGGDDRAALLGVLYLLLAVGTADAMPDPDELAWVAELGEEVAVDVACGVPDRAARLLLDGDRWQLWTRVEAALAQVATGDDRRLRDAARTLDREFRTVVLRHSIDGVRQTLDAVLAGVTDAHAPGTAVPGGTVVGARWTTSGPPTAYEVRADDGTVSVMEPGDVRV